MWKIDIRYYVQEFHQLAHPQMQMKSCDMPSMNCSTIVRRGEMRAHLTESAKSHIKMQFEEIRRLRCTICVKVIKKI